MFPAGPVPAIQPVVHSGRSHPNPARELSPGKPRFLQTGPENLPDAVVLSPQGDFGKVCVDAGNPVEGEEPEAQVDRSQVDEQVTRIDHVHVPGTLALDPGHERVPPGRRELDGIGVHPGGRHCQRQVRLKVRDEAHVNEGLPQGKEDTPDGYARWGLEFRKNLRAVRLVRVWPSLKVQGLDDGAENLPAVQPGERTLLGNGGTFLTLLRHQKT